MGEEPAGELAAVKESVDVQEVEEAIKAEVTQGETAAELEAPAKEVAAVTEVDVQQAKEAGKAELTQAEMAADLEAPAGDVAALAEVEVTEGAVVNKTCGWFC